MNNRSAQFVAAALAFVLIALVGATIFILLSKPAGPGPTPSATLPTFGPTSSFSPSPTLTFATPTPTPSPTATATLLPTPTLIPTIPPTATPTPTASPTPTISPTPSPSPTLSPSPSPSPSPTASPTPPPAGDNQNEVTLVDVGLDQRSDPAGVQRTVSFAVDGPSVITAQLQNVNSGKVRMCLLRDDPPQKQCIVAHSGTLSLPVYDTGSSNWNLTLLGMSGVAGQTASMTLDFNAVTPSIRLDSFRFNGTNDPNYNGFTIFFGGQSMATGDVSLHASIDDGNGHPYLWHFTIAADDVPVYDSGDSGPSTSVDQTATNVPGGTVYTATFYEPEPSAGGGLYPVFVDATLTWP